MDEILAVYKPVGTTPLELLRQLRQERADLSDLRLGYAGRLDPMADGLLLVLVGAANDNQPELSRLTKSYRATIILGVATDSYDVLGMVRQSIKPPPITPHQARQAVAGLQGSFDQPYPPYSAVRVEGKPLFWWARQQRLDEISIPHARRTIFESQLLELSSLSSVDLQAEVQRRISLVTGDFRQVDTLDSWQTALSQQQMYPTVTFNISCSSGTYIRSLSQVLGERFGCPATTLHLTRVRVGDYQLEQALYLASC
jgi:tRNA pseudouridine55 synthase